MKKLLIFTTIVLAVACNSGNDEVDSSSADSSVNTNTEVNINDDPMRTRDTSQNIMKDTLNGKNIDTMKKGSAQP